jgi:ATP-binding cassette subfamily B protein
MEPAVDLAWPVGGLAAAVEQLAIASGMRVQHAGGRRQPASADNVDGGVERLTRSLDFEAEAGDVSYDDVARTLQTAGPALIRLSHGGQHRFLAVLGSRGRTVRLLAPDGRRRSMPIADAAASIRRHLEAPLDDYIEGLLDTAKISGRRRPAARRALLSVRLNQLTATRCWLIRPTPQASLWQHMRHARLPQRLIVFLIAYAGAAVAGVCAWWLIGAAALNGRFDAGTLLAWSFLLLSLVPLGLFARWAQGVFVVGVSGILKQRLLAGALKLDPDETRHQGVGQHLARVLESESVEALTLSGGFYAVVGCFELALASMAFIAIASYVALALLVSASIALGVIGAYYYRTRQRWTTVRLDLTHDLVERMVGHRTRLVQEAPGGRHDDEDTALEQYVELSRLMDRAGLIFSLVPRVWLIAALAALAPAFVSTDASIGVLAASVGATLLALGAFGKITSSLATLSDAAISWQQVAPLIQALERAEPAGHVDAIAEPLSATRGGRSGSLVTAQDLSYKFADRAGFVLDGCSFRVASGDRIRLTGASGAGKSTLISMLTAMRAPDSGLLLLDGLDCATLGLRGWRRRVTAAPQFHENYLFNDTLAFNLLMARRWPPSAEDVLLAETACRRLGLGDLLDRMPSGIFQLVGETGWQVSHGERSRIFMARALLQGADLVILDESFAELDPDSLQRCLPEAAQLARSLIVVAHA